MKNFDHIPDAPLSTVTLEDVGQMREEHARERGTTMDILHDLWAGTGQALELFGRGTGMEGIQRTGEAIAKTGFAKPDTSQYFGSQDRLGRVVDGIFQSLPTTIAIGGTAAAGGLLAGPVGAAAGLTGAMGILGSGVFDQSMEEIMKERPDLPQAEQFNYAAVNAASEVGSEVLSFLVPFGIGKAFSKVASKSVMNALVDSGRLTTGEAIALAVKSAGGKETVKAMLGGATADGASEVVNELVQAANRESVGLEENPVDLIDIFLIGSAPGGIIAGGTIGLDIAAKNRVRKNLEAGLQSEDAVVRMGTVSTIASGLSAVSPEVGEAFSKSLLEKARVAPVSLETEVQTASVEETIINKPEEILEEAGIPSSKPSVKREATAATLRTTDRSAEFQAQQEVERQEAQRLDRFRTKQGTPVEVQAGIQAETAQRAAIEREKVELSAPEVHTIEKFMQVEDTKVHTMADYRKAMDDEAIKSSILMGMEQVEADTNNLKNPQLTLVERRQLRKSIQNTKDMINEEVALIKKSQAKPTTVKPKADTTVKPKADTTVKPKITPEPTPVVEPTATPVVEPEVTPVAKAPKTPKAAPKVEAEVTLPEIPAEPVAAPPEAPAAVSKEAPEAVSIEEPAMSPETAKAAMDLVDKGHPAEEAMSLAKELKQPKLIEAASSLIKKGIKAADAIILAKKGISKVDKPVEVERTMQDVKTPEGKTAKRLKSIRFTGGERIEVGTKKTEGKQYKVFAKDGLVYRANSQAKAIKFIQGEGTLELWEDKQKATILTKEEKALGKANKDKINAFLKKHNDNMAEVTKLVVGKAKIEDAQGKVAHAIARAAKKQGNLNVSTIRAELVKLETAERNVSESTRKAKASISTASVSAEDMFASEEAKAGREDMMDDVEVEDVMLSDEDVTDIDEKPAAERNVYIQEGKGKYELKNQWFEPDGSKVSAEKKSKDAKVVKQTPDGRYSVYNVKTDGNLYKVAVLKEGEPVGGLFADLAEAKEFIEEYDRRDATEQEEERRTVIRRRKEVDEEISNLDPAISRANKFLAVAPDISGAIQMVESMESTPENTATLKYLKDLKDNVVTETSRYQNANDMLESVATTKTGAGKLATFLLERANTLGLDDVKIVIGDFNGYDAGTNQITIKAESTPATRLHEVVHVLTSKVLNSKEGESFKKEVRGIMDEVKKYALDNGLLTKEDVKVLESLETSQDFRDTDHTFTNRALAYTLLNEKEFLANTFGSRSIQDILNNVKVDKKRSIVDKFIDFVLKALGLDVKNHTALKEVLLLTEEISYENVIESSAFDMELAQGDKEYQEARANKVPKLDTEVAKIMAGRGPKAKAKEKLFENAKNIKSMAEKLMRPVSDIILARSEKLHSKLMKFEANLIMKEREYSTKAKPFMTWFKGLSESNQARYSLALMNSNTEESQAVINTIPKDIMKGVNEVLADLRERQENVGLGVTDKEYYFPRRVTDINSLMDHLASDSVTKGKLNYAFTEEAKRLGVNELTPEQQTQVVTDMMQSGYLRQLPRPGASKKRTVPFVTAETFGFYANASDALMGHIFEMNEKIGQREFIGGSQRKKKVNELLKEYNKIQEMKEGPERALAIQEYDSKAKALENLEADLEESLAAVVRDELGDKTSAEQDEVIELINARLRQRGAHGVADAFRNITYMATMGNFLSTITQLADIPIILYAHGLNRDSLGAVGTAFKNVFHIAKGELTGKPSGVDAFVEQADFTNQLREFSTGSVTAEWVDKVFKYSGLKYTDLVGKEAFMQAAYKKYQREGGKEKFFKKFESMFGEDTQRVYEDIKAGRKNADVLTAMITELSDFQPITLSQQSQVYLTGGNARLFYMLKTFQLRATSAALREGVTEINKGGSKNIAKGVAKIGAIMMIYAAAGASADELKDLIRGKETDLSDSVQDNILKMMFMSKYTLQKGTKEDGILKSIMSNLLPPVRHFDNFGADVYGLLSEEKEFKAKSLQVIPLIGTTVYARSAAGQASYAAQERQAILDAVAENRKDKKGAYAGGLSKRIREYNKGVSRDKQLTNDSIMRKFNATK